MRLVSVCLLAMLLMVLAPQPAAAQDAQLLDGNAAEFPAPPAKIAYANTEFAAPPAGVTITSSQGLWRFNGWVALMDAGQWIEAKVTEDKDFTAGVQFWGDTNDGWGRVLVDGKEVWRGNTYGSDVEYPGGAFVKYLRISGLAAGTHTIRVESLGQTGPGGGDDVAVYFFGVGDVEPSRTGPFIFYAIYDRIADVESHDIDATQVALSGDGKKVAIAGGNQDSAPVLYTANFDGSNMRQVPLPQEVKSVNNLRISRDGKRAFFHNQVHHYPQIYKVENGIATLIFNAHNYDAVNDVTEIEITGDGEYVFFTEDRDDLWRVHHSGGAPQRIIDDAAVPRDGGTGAFIGAFAIDADGGTIAFVLRGYYDPGNVYRSKEEVFVWQNGATKQLTNDTPASGKAHPALGGNGAKLVFWDGGVWVAMNVDGSGRVELAEAPFNLDRAVLTHDGKIALNNLSRLFWTDGSRKLDLFPAWNVTGIALGVYKEANISDDGTRIAFSFEYATWPFKRAAYVGYLNEPEAVPSAPVIEQAVFSPPAMSRNDPKATQQVKVFVSDPQGLDDVQRVTVHGMLGGLHQDIVDLPVKIPFYPHDDGKPPDVTEKDGVYTTFSEPGAKVAEYDAMTVRFGARDKSQTVVVADTTVPVAQTGTVEGVVFEDRNGNGVQDAGEPGIPNAKVMLANTPILASFLADIRFQESAVTDADGEYVFSSVPAGNYMLAVMPPTGWHAPPPVTLGVQADKSTQAPASGVAADSHRLFLPALCK